MPIVNFFPKISDETKYSELALVVCNQCWALQLRSAPEPSDLYVEYHHRSGASDGNIEHLKRFSDVIASITDKNKSSNILEIGCNDLTLFSELSKKIDGKIIGIDPALNIRVDGETDVYRDFFNKRSAKVIETDHGRMDVIFGLNVFAHVPSVVEMFKAVNELLADDGIFIFEVAYAFNTILRGAFDTVYHEHFFNWTMTSINYALKSANLFPIKVELLNTQGGSLRIYASKSAYKENSSVTELIAKEEQAGVNSMQIYKSLGKLIALELDQCFAKLIDSTSINEKIGIIGAPARGVTFLNALFRRHGDLEKMHWVIGDDTPEKIGNYFPGTLTQVSDLNEKTLAECSRFLILAWTYEKNLKARFKNVLMDKKIIIPFQSIGKKDE